MDREPRGVPCAPAIAGGEARERKPYGAGDGAGWGFPRCVATEERRVRVECGFAVLYGTVLYIEGRQPEAEAAKQGRIQHSTADGSTEAARAVALSARRGRAVGSFLPPIRQSQLPRWCFGTLCGSVLSCSGGLPFSWVPPVSVSSTALDWSWTGAALRPLICIGRSHSK